MSAFHRLGALLTATAMGLASSILVPPPVRGSPNWAALAQSLTSSERSRFRAVVNGFVNETQRATTEMAWNAA
jgi:hypothetical protein